MKYNPHPKTEKKLEDFNFQKKSKRNESFSFPLLILDFL